MASAWPYASPSLPGNSTQADGAGAGTGLTADMIKRLELYRAIMGMGRGAGGMQLNPNTSNLINQLQGGGQQGGQQGMMSPQMMQLLQYYLQNQANNLGPQQGGSMQGPAFPQGGGGVDLSTLLGTLGFPTR